MTQHITEPGAGAWAPTDDATRIARAIVRSRSLDDAVGGLSRRGVVGMIPPARAIEGHLYGALAALRPTDWSFGDVRMGAVALERGLPLRAWLAMLLGTSDAAHAGHASSSEITAASVRCVSTSSLLGTHLAQAGGVAHAMKVKGTDECVLAWFGPGAAASGDAHVAMNFAGVYRTPAIFYHCGSGDDAADRERLGGDSVAERAQGYGIEADVVDGSDPLAVRDAVAAAAARARAGEGPTLIEGRTGGDPLASLDPDPADVEAWSQELGADIRALTDELRAGGPPRLATLFEHVFAEPDARLREQRTRLEAHRARFDGGELAS